MVEAAFVDIALGADSLRSLVIEFVAFAFDVVFCL